MNWAFRVSFTPSRSGVAAGLFRGFKNEASPKGVTERQRTDKDLSCDALDTAIEVMANIRQKQLKLWLAVRQNGIPNNRYVGVNHDT